jgi:hypothetical protein
MLNDEASALDSFQIFLKAHQSFTPTELDAVILNNRDVDAAVHEARRQLGKDE